MKRIIAFIMLTAMITATLASCKPANDVTTGITETEEPYVTPEEIANDTERVVVTGIKIGKKSITCNVNDIFEVRSLQAEVIPEDATYKDLIYQSSDTDVLVIMDNLVMAAANGTAKLKVRTKDGGFLAVCTVKVGTGVKEEKTQNDPTEVTGIEVVPSSVEMFVDDNKRLSINVLPKGAVLVGGVNWASSDDSVAYMDGDVLFAKSAGTATITATSVDGKFKAECKVTVNDLADKFGVTSVALDIAEKTISVGESFTLNATVKPDTAVNKFIIWSTSDEAVAKVDSTGKVTAVASGVAVIKVFTIDGGYTAECTVTVK